METTLRKLSQQEEKYTTRLNDVLQQYSDLKEQTEKPSVREFLRQQQTAQTPCHRKKKQLER